MSSNVELVQSVFAAWERGDYSFVEWADPEMELVVADGPDPGTWKGRVRIAEAMRSLLSAWEGYRSEAEEYRELDGERVLVLHHRSGRGKASGLELGQMRTQGAGVFHIRGGKVTRIVGYMNRERAFADLGLAPEAGSPHP